MPNGECQTTSTKYQYRELRELDRALGTMRKFGILESSDSYKALFGIRGKLMSQLGFKIPRPFTLIAKLAGLSPGTVNLWHDAESGWISEARSRPGAPPVYRSIGDEVAMAIIKGELTHEAFLFLQVPEINIDN